MEKLHFTLALQRVVYKTHVQLYDQKWFSILIFKKYLTANHI